MDFGTILMMKRYSRKEEKIEQKGQKKGRIVKCKRKKETKKTRRKYKINENFEKKKTQNKKDQKKKKSRTSF